jgi:NAD(P)H-dependent FMN reductase
MMIKLAVIVGTTRPNRFADHPTKWLLEALEKREDIATEVLDLRDWPLPFFNARPALDGPDDDVTVKWARRINDADAYIVIAGEYNHSFPAVLKNALDHGYVEWNNKPVGFIGYGGVGGARGIEQLRLVAVELQMAPIRNAVHVPVQVFLDVLKEGKTLNDFPFLDDSRKGLIDQLVWWAKTLKAGRETTPVA